MSADELLFVPYDNRAKSAHTYTTPVRKHVMRKFRRVESTGGHLQRSGGNVNAVAAPLSLRTSPDDNAHLSSPVRDNGLERTRQRPAEHTEVELIARGYHLPSQARYLGSGRQDPFIAYPVPLWRRARQLLDVFLDDRNSRSRDFRSVWYPILGSSDLAVFYMSLSMTALLCSRVQQSSAIELEASRYHTHALTSVQSRLSDPLQCNSDGVVAAVAAFAISSRNLFGIDVWEKHVVGLKRILDTRGGAEKIRPRHIRMLVFMADMSGSARIDVKLRFPIPTDIFPNPVQLRTLFRPSRDVETAIDTWLSMWPQRTGIVQILKDVAVLVQSADYQAAEDARFFVKSKMPGDWILPMLGRCLQLIPEGTSGVEEQYLDQVGFEMQEAIRHGVFLYLGLLRRAFNVNDQNPVVRIQKLKDVLTSTRQQWVYGLSSLLLWILVSSAILAEDTASQIWFVEYMVEHPLLMNMSDNDIISSLRRFIWMDKFPDRGLLRLVSQTSSVRTWRRLDHQWEAGDTCQVPRTTSAIPTETSATTEERDQGQS